MVKKHFVLEQQDISISVVFQENNDVIPWKMLRKGRNQNLLMGAHNGQFNLVDS
ncbi:hypothetical protein ACJX0J_036250, partial [Zea mays]